ncbi:hypothetical protein [Pseudanabaena sp. ABRG5-3]|uniref:hypothetical protein n=1 Tax=Pseudanabaena sp. ABRG5-3 TaxID=685565 RepID=UPI000DC71AC1|nr:hypothetical protein [Pseudanabaena sp. ABRG5-3]BBC22888.1 hypothetical protein ABRG53_0631 [Pseudanabaena sp. ABRG5-3]
MINTTSKNTNFFLAIQNQSNSLKAISLSLDTCISSNDIPCLQPNNYDDIVAQVSQHPTNPSIIGLQNCSTNNWLVKLPNGETTNLATGKTVKLENQTHISFGEVRAAILDDVSFYRILSTGVLPSDNLEKVASNKYQTSTAKKLESDNPEKKNKTKLFAFTSIIGVAILAIAGYFIYPFIVKPSPQISNISTNQLTTNQPQAPEETEKVGIDKTSSITSQPYKPTTSTPNLVTNLSKAQKNWKGYFGSRAAYLEMDSFELSNDQNSANFTGKLTVLFESSDTQNHIIEIKGSIEANTEEVTFRELKVLQPYKNNWYLGINSGTVSNSFFSMSGNGRDTQSTKYTWCLDHIDSVKNCKPPNKNTSIDKKPQTSTNKRNIPFDTENYSIPYEPDDSSKSGNIDKGNSQNTDTTTISSSNIPVDEAIQVIEEAYAKESKKYSDFFKSQRSTFDPKLTVSDISFLSNTNRKDTIDLIGNVRYVEYNGTLVTNRLIFTVRKFDNQLKLINIRK